MFGVFAVAVQKMASPPVRSKGEAWMSEDETLVQVRRLYALWASGALSSEETMFQLGDALGDVLGEGLDRIEKAPADGSPPD
jgi:hypothetical protein